MTKHVIIYSHGFGVRKDARGMFTDLASAMPDDQHILFDYGQYDDAHNTLTIPSLSEQKRKLEEIISKARKDSPGATVDLICHSQGCVVAAMLKPTGIHKVIFTAPPATLSIERMRQFFGSRPGAVFDLAGTSSFPRRDGSTTLLQQSYWDDIRSLDPIALYNDLADTVPITIIHARHDEVLGSKDFSRLNPNIKGIDLDGSHDFAGEARRLFIEEVRQELADKN